MELGWLTIASDGRQVLFPSEEARRAAVRVLARVVGPAALLFRVVDDHLHVVVGWERARVGWLSRALVLGLRPLAAAPVEGARVRPVESRAHLESLVGYVLSQTSHHGLAEHPALWTGSCFRDLVGARWLPPLAGRERLSAHLPRLPPSALQRAVGLSGRAVEPADDAALRGARQGGSPPPSPPRSRCRLRWPGRGRRSSWRGAPSRSSASRAGSRAATWASRWGSRRVPCGACSPRPRRTRCCSPRGGGTRSSRRSPRRRCRPAGYGHGHRPSAWARPAALTPEYHDAVGLRAKPALFYSLRFAARGATNLRPEPRAEPVRSCPSPSEPEPPAVDRARARARAPAFGLGTSGRTGPGAPRRRWVAGEARAVMGRGQCNPLSDVSTMARPSGAGAGAGAGAGPRR
jgi:hypothetical protein